MEEKNKVMGSKEIVIDEVAPFKETVVVAPAETDVKEVEQSPYLSGKMNVSGYVYSAPSTKKLWELREKGKKLNIRKLIILNGLNLKMEDISYANGWGD